MEVSPRSSSGTAGLNGLVSAIASATEIEQVMWVINPAKLGSIAARISRS